MIEFKDFAGFQMFAQAINGSIWEPNEKKMSEFLILNPTLPAKLKALWYEILNREYGAWGLTLNEHARIFSAEAETLLGEHEWLIPGNCFSGWGLARVCSQLLKEQAWEHTV